MAGESEILAWEEEWFEWWSRHALRSARSGGLFPNVVFRRFRDQIEISWRDEPIAGAPEGFSFSSAIGDSLLPVSVVADALHGLVDAAVQYLSKINPESPRIKRLSASLERIGLPSQVAEREQWLAGVHRLPAFERRLQSLTVEDDLQSAWSLIVSSLRGSGQEAAAEAALDADETPLATTGASQAALLFGSVSPTVTGADVDKLVNVLLEQFTPGATESAELRKLTRHAPLDSSMPAWEQGYELAEEIFQEVADDADWVDIVGILKRLGVSLTEISLDDPSIRACTIVGPNHRPTTALNMSSSFSGDSSAIRFTLAHELCHLIFDRAHGQRLSIASGSWAPRGIERRANAFSAMLLMPSVLVERALADLPDPVSDVDGLAAFAERLRVSRRAALRHLYNLTLMSEGTHDELLRRLPAA